MIVCALLVPSTMLIDDVIPIYVFIGAGTSFLGVLIECKKKIIVRFTIISSFVGFLSLLKKINFFFVKC